ncbi:MAG: hypothetical protein RL081_1447, partial [Pseudomonadota bacterium]
DAIAGGLVPGWASLAARLRDHGQRSDDFAAHDNRQVCMHAGSMLRPSQTTASLIARLAPHQEVRMAATGTSAPCLSLLEPLRVAEPTAGSQVIAPGSRVGDSAWAKFEPVHHRALFDAAFRQPLHAERDALEARCLAHAVGTAGQRFRISGPWPSGRLVAQAGSARAGRRERLFPVSSFAMPPACVWPPRS